MERIKSQIEGQIQEIVFFGSLIISFSIFLSGIFYLALSPESLVFILGQFGAAIDHGLFSVFGYAFFYLAVISLHMGYVTNFHVFNYRDLKREAPVLLYSLLAHVIILCLFSTLLTVFQVYLEIPSSQELSRGAGGFIGSIFGTHFYAALGIYGSLLILLALKIATAIAAGFFELPDVLIAVKSASKTTGRLTFKGAKTLNATLVNGAQFFLKGNEFSEATAMGTQHAGRMISRSINKANNIFTEHFHIYRDENEEAPIKAHKVEKKAEVKVDTKPVVAKKSKMGSAMAARSEQLMNSLKELKNRTSRQMTSMKRAPAKAIVVEAKKSDKKTEKKAEKVEVKTTAKKKSAPAVKAKAKKK